MIRKIFNIQEFVNYAKFSPIKNENLHIVNFENEKDILRKSQKINIDFYLMAIKPPLEKNQIIEQNFEDQANSFLYMDCPQNTMDWESRYRQHRKRQENMGKGKRKNGKRPGEIIAVLSENEKGD